MAGDLLSTLTGFYQTKYRNVMNTDVPRIKGVPLMIFNRAKKIELGGLTLATTWSHEVSVGAGFGILAEAGDFPAAGYDAAQNPTLAMVRVSGSVRWSGHALKAGSQTRFDGKKLIKKKLGVLTNVIKRNIARQMMWNSSAIWGQVGTVSTATAGAHYFTIKSGGVPSQFLEGGQTLTFRDLTSGGTEQATVDGGTRVTSADHAYDGGARIYCANLTGVSADDYFALANCYDQTVVNGIRALIDSTGTVQGLDRSLAANVFARCVEQDANSAAMGPSRVDLLRDTVMDNAEMLEEGYEATWAGNRKMRRWAGLSTIGQVRFPSIDEMVVGTRSIKINDKDGEKTFVEDPHFLDGELYAACWDKFVIGYPEGEEGGSPILNGDSPVFQALAASGDGYSDSYLSYAQWSGNIGLDHFRCQGKGINLASP